MLVSNAWSRDKRSSLFSRKNSNEEKKFNETETWNWVDESKGQKGQRVLAVLVKIFI
jgi:hypothetical protein